MNCNPGTYLCRIPTREEQTAKWDFEIAHAGEERENWVRWKKRYLARYASGDAIPYYGFLDGKCICEGTACITSEGVQNSDGLVSENTVYLCAFRTVEAFQGQGYFSRLFRFLAKDLKGRGFRYATVGVEPEEEENLAIYRRLGFTEYIKQSQEQLPDGTTLRVDYYRAAL